MSFVYYCLLFLAQLANAYDIPIRSDAPLATATGQPYLAAETSFVSSADTTIPVEESDQEDDSQDDSPAIPGAIVAVIFGVFGLLVIGRRSER